MPRSIALRVLVTAWFFGCTPSRTSSPPGTATGAPASSTPPLAASDLAPDAGAPNPSADPEADPEPRAPTRAIPSAFRRVRAEPVSSIAAGKPPKLAALARGEVLLFEDSRWQRLAAPETEDPELAVEVFFGRDDHPRLMGYRRSGARTEPFYRRYRGGRFRPEPSELGPLSAPDGALYGVLGHADPEVVCVPGRFCLVKRVSGWSRAGAHREPVRVVLTGGAAWALGRASVERLEGERWVAMAPERTWHAPADVLVDADGAILVVEPALGSVTRLRDGRWEPSPVPIRRPLALASSSPADLWLVGEGGAAHFDGSTWARVPGVEGPLERVMVAAGIVWLAGSAGLYQSEPRADARATGAR